MLRFINEECDYGLWYQVVDGLSNNVKVGKDTMFEYQNLMIIFDFGVSWVIVICSLGFNHFWHLNFFYALLHIFFYIVVDYIFVSG